MHSQAKKFLWQYIANQVEPQIREVRNVTSVSGGDINQSFMLTGICAKTSQIISYFIKLNRADLVDMFAQEAFGLECLAQTQTIRVPKVVSFGEFESHSFLVLQPLVFARGKMTDFACALANLHCCYQAHGQFGLAKDNYIGTTRQLNGFDSNWGRFFAEQRLGFQLQLLAEKGAGSWVSEAQALLPAIRDWLNQFECRASLVHGDLWQGNLGFDQQGQPVIFDPAIYYGDAEVDLAMLQLFGSLSDDFFTKYQKINPLSGSAQQQSQRQLIYNFYHILNHGNLFAGSYLEQSKQLVQQIKLLV